MIISPIHLRKSVEWGGADGLATGRPQGRKFTPFSPLLIDQRCEYSVYGSLTVTRNAIFTPHDAFPTLDHPRAAHGPTGTPHGPPGLTFTPSRYCHGKALFTAVAREHRIAAAGAPPCRPRAPSAGARTPSMPARHAHAPAPAPPAHARPGAPEYTQTSCHTRVRYSRKGQE